MDIQITARHFHASPELQDEVREKIEHLGRFYHQITGAYVVLDAEKERVRKIEVRMHILDKAVAAHAEEENMGKAIESVVEKLEKILKKENEKLKEHRGVPIEEVVAS